MKKRATPHHWWRWCPRRPRRRPSAAATCAGAQSRWRAARSARPGARSQGGCILATKAFCSVPCGSFWAAAYVHHAQGYPRRARHCARLATPSAGRNHIFSPNVIRLSLPAPPCHWLWLSKALAAAPCQHLEGCGPHLNTEPYVQPSASVLWSKTRSHLSGSSLGWGLNTSGWPSASLHVGRSSRAGDCLQGGVTGYHSS